MSSASSRRLLTLSMVLMFVLARTTAQAGGLVDPISNISEYGGALSYGIASYGLSDIGGDYGPYQVSTNEVVGDARIGYMLAYNSSLAAQQNLSDYGASLQLNAVANITAGGRTYVYWLQNVMDFNTSNSTYYPVDNIWNLTTPTASLNNASLIGSGNVTASPTQLANGTVVNEGFYVYSPNVTYAYKYPLNLEPFILLQMNGVYPMVRMGLIDNGTYAFYDNVTFNIPNGTATIIVTPYYQTPSPQNPDNGSYYDAEFVFGSESNGTTTDYSQMNATLWLGYAGVNALVPFPYLATFALDTGESALGLSVVQGPGDAIVTTGAPDYNTTISLAGAPGRPNMRNAPPQFYSNSTVTTIVYNATAVQGGVESGDGGALQVILILLLAAFVFFVYRNIVSGKRRQQAEGQVQDSGEQTGRP